MEINRERLLVRLNNGDIIEEKIRKGDGAYSYDTKDALNTFIDICLGKNVKNHSNFILNEVNDDMRL